MSTWYDYRAAWSAHPWVLALAILAVALLVVSIVGTVSGGFLAFLFIPGLAVAYVHHLIAMKNID